MKLLHCNNTGFISAIGAFERSLSQKICAIAQKKHRGDQMKLSGCFVKFGFVLALLTSFQQAAAQGLDKYQKGLDAIAQKDWSAAETYLNAACDDDVAIACGSLARLQANGQTGVIEMPEFVGLLQKACDGDDAKSCNSLGLVKEDEGDYALVRDLYEKACALGDLDGCTNRGLMFETGAAENQDYGKAQTIYEDVCRRHGASGCRNLGRLYMEGSGVPQDGATAAKYLEKACALDPAYGCILLASLYYEGNGVAKDDVRARRYNEKACDGEIARGCSNVAYYYQNGIGTAASNARAHEWFLKGCSLGDENQCALAHQIASPLDQLIDKNAQPSRWN
jgi:uncharacterized protein